MDTRFENISPEKKIYLASDFHLGAPSRESSLKREKKIIEWLSKIETDAQAIFLVGDIFDFWFEYKHVIPKGFIRFQGKLAELVDKGIEIIFYTGNHDMWMFDYFTTELGIEIIRKPRTFKIGKSKIMIGHGDGLGPGDRFYKILKVLFSSKILQWLFEWLHPNVGISIAEGWSKHSRINNHESEEIDQGEKEWLYQYCLEVQQQNPHDYFIFGHRHLPLQKVVAPGAQYINLGEWINHSSYLEIQAGQVNLKYFEG